MHFMKKWKKWKIWFLLCSRGVQVERGWLDACNSFWCICNPYPSQLSNFFILELIIFCICKNSVSSFYSTLELSGMWWCFWIIIPKIFYSQLVVPILHWLVILTKKLLHVLGIYVGIKILQHLADFTTCLRHV